jgi:hypothetical protein
MMDEPLPNNRGAQHVPGLSLWGASPRIFRYRWYDGDISIVANSRRVRIMPPAEPFDDVPRAPSQDIDLLLISSALIAFALLQPKNFIRFMTPSSVMCKPCYSQVARRACVSEFVFLKLILQHSCACEMRLWLQIMQLTSHH